ncbi:hypothetical protein Y032_0311g2140 [Ancylostoma ceylanicum]|uniref:Peptidase M13 C-terminal domain-containing protein n=1 Tax=Ancylostoma ceylanicum TaxID=53326 RepID=A0A016S232_9BILA|nr:hypothetical protein Y032_0311g2140 [Ancylostoma ceylanicum]
MRSARCTMSRFGGCPVPAKAYRTHIKNHGFEPRLDTMQDFNNEQAFFLGYATQFCTRYSLKETKHMLKGNEHSLTQLRVNNVLANIPEFAEAFHCAPGARMNPEERCSMY